MPIYEYECDNCNNLWEELEPYETDGNVCPKCGLQEVHRLISKNTMPIFKGEGFHCNDYSNTSKGSFVGDDGSCTRGY